MLFIPATLTKKEILILMPAEAQAETQFDTEKQTSSALRLVFMNYINIPKHFPWDEETSEALAKRLWIMDQAGKWYEREPTTFNYMILDAFLLPKNQRDIPWLCDQIKQAKNDFTRETQTISALQLIVMYYKEFLHGTQENKIWIEKQGWRLMGIDSSIENMELVALCLPDTKVGLEAQTILNKWHKDT